MLKEALSSYPKGTTFQQLLNVNLKRFFIYIYIYIYIYIITLGVTILEIIIMRAIVRILHLHRYVRIICISQY